MCDNRNVRRVLAREPITAPHEITWRKQSDTSVNLRRSIQCQIASHIPTARVTPHELTWRKDSVPRPYICSSLNFHPQTNISLKETVINTYISKLTCSWRHLYMSWESLLLDLVSVEGSCGVNISVNRLPSRPQSLHFFWKFSSFFNLITPRIRFAP